MSPRDRSFLGLGPQGFHRVAYREWGDPANPRVLVCVHGLTRNGHDFDTLAGVLQGEWRVVCPDLPGRGASDWLPDASNYDFPVYLGDMAALLARLDIERVDWLGTSLGGLIGMFLAAQSNSPIRRLVLNDVGPLVPQAGVERLCQAAALPAPSFASLEEAERWFRAAMATFGRLDDAAWRAIAEHGVRRLPDGQLGLHFDPAILAGLLTAPPKDIDLWPVWERVSCPVLAIRGDRSDFLSAQMINEMRARGAGCSEIVVADTGHAPMLMDPAEIRAIAAWLGR